MACGNAATVVLSEPSPEGDMVAVIDAVCVEDGQFKVYDGGRSYTINRILMNVTMGGQADIFTIYIPGTSTPYWQRTNAVSEQVRVNEQVQPYYWRENLPLTVGYTQNRTIDPGTCIHVVLYLNLKLQDTPATEAQILVQEGPGGEATYG